jgi:tetratricopeptide (TPR) repeat protein
MSNPGTLVQITPAGAPPSPTELAQDAAAHQFHLAAIRLFKEGCYPDARQSIIKALRLAESSVRWNDFATILLGCNEHVAAGLGYRRAVELDSANAQAAANLDAFKDAFEKKIATPPGASALRPVTDAHQLLQSLQPEDTAPSALNVDAIFRRICALPLADATAPKFLHDAIRRGFPYTGYFVRQALAILQGVTDAERAALVSRIEGAENDPRCQTLAAVLMMMKDDYIAAIPRLRAAITAQPTDLFAIDALMEALRLSSENGPENIAARELPAYLAAHTCSRPWSHVEMTEPGNAHLCCPTWLPVSIGNLAESSADQMWHSEAAEAVRASVVDGSFSFCNKLHCPHIASRSLPEKKAEAVFIPIAAIKNAPAEVTLSYDASCNLACPMCRKDFITATRAEQEAMDKRFVPWVEAAVAHADTLYLNGSGDVFGSKHSRDLLSRMTRQRYPNLRFRIITNALLLDERAYRDLDLAGRIGTLEVSIDAATAETYSVVRRGGNFDRLTKNLEFLDGLRTAGKDHFSLELMYVVSAHNFREMPAFVHLAKRFHANLVTFTMVRANVGLTPEETKKWAAFDPDHPLYAEFLEVTQAPEMKDPMVITTLALA